MPPVAPVIVTERLSKRFGRLEAVRNLDLEVARGEIFGFLGLNGAGKTTTIRMLLDLRRPTGGTAGVFGRDCQRDGLGVRRLVGYLPGELGYYGDMTGRAILDLLGHLSARPIDPEWRGHLLDRLELPESDLARRLRDYSAGMKRKLGIVQAFQAEPPLLILDEPTEGLDPLVQESFYELLFEARRRGATVFMSSHVLSEVEHVCDRVAVIRAGALAVVAAVDEIKRLSPRRVVVTFDRDVAPESSAQTGCTVVEAAARRWVLGTSGRLGELTRVLGGLPVIDVEVRTPRLEDVLRRFYRDGDGR